ncbi:MAG: hypothetical protein EHM68_09345 [Lysobacterales bacterium]|nr:MAG: hypothetical protein EHM68_09345 [Xanthomonadales bacterium]
MWQFFFRPSARLVAALMLMGLAPAAPAAELVRQFSGDRSTETVEFEAEAPWLIDWLVNSDFPDSMGVEVTLVNASGAYEGRVFKTKRPDNGVRLIQESGRYFFKVESTVSSWTLKVQQLTAEEAEQFTPKAQSPLD